MPEMEMPRPDGVSTPAEFVAGLRALRSWSGLTYRQLEGKANAAGDVLPHSTLASALVRQTLPREDLIAVFVRACGGDPDIVAAWITARKRVAVAEDTGPSQRSPADTVELEVPPHHPQADTFESGWLPQAPLRYADGQLAAAVATTRDGRWVGLHRKRDPGDTTPFRLRDLLPPLVFRTGWASRVLLCVVLLLLTTITAGVIVRSQRETGARDSVAVPVEEESPGEPSPTSPPVTEPPATPAPVLPATPGLVTATPPVNLHRVYRTAVSVTLGFNQGADLDLGTVGEVGTGVDVTTFSGATSLWPPTGEQTLRFALLPASAAPAYERCVGLPSAADKNTFVPGSWSRVVKDIDELAAGRNICVRSTAGRIAMLTVQKPPGAPVPSFSFSYVVWAEA